MKAGLMNRRLLPLFVSSKILLTPGLDNTRLFMSLTAGAGTRSMVISVPRLCSNLHGGSVPRLIVVPL